MPHFGGNNMFNYSVYVGSETVAICKNVQFSFIMKNYGNIINIDHTLGRVEIDPDAYYNK